MNRIGFILFILSSIFNARLTCARKHLSQESEELSKGYDRSDSNSDIEDLARNNNDPGGNSDSSDYLPLRTGPEEYFTMFLNQWELLVNHMKQEAAELYFDLISRELLHYRGPLRQYIEQLGDKFYTFSKDGLSAFSEYVNDYLKSDSKQLKSFFQEFNQLFNNADEFAFERYLKTLDLYVIGRFTNIDGYTVRIMSRIANRLKKMDKYHVRSLNRKLERLMDYGGYSYDFSVDEMVVPVIKLRHKV